MNLNSAKINGNQDVTQVASTCCYTSCNNTTSDFNGGIGKKLVRGTGFSFFNNKSMLNMLALFLGLFAFIAITASDANAQCGFNTAGNYNGGAINTLPCGSDRTASLGPLQWTYFYQRTGSNYTVTTCNGGQNWDTQISIYDYYSPYTGIAYNDDSGCSPSFASTVTYTATYNGWVKVQLNRYNCAGWTSGVNSAVLRMRENPPATPSNPSGGGTYCASSATLSRTSNPPTGITWHWVNSPTSTTSLGTGSTLNVTSNGTYYLRSKSYGCWGSASAGATVTLQNSAGTANTFGNGYWYVSCYIGNSFNTYAGYYTQNGYSFNTTNRWGSSSTPSAANSSGGNAYQGCTIPVDQHSTRHRRQNFACGVYRIDVPNHDDNVVLYVNGTEVWRHDGCCDAHTGVWTGELNSSSTVEITHREGTGGSHVGLSVVDITASLNGGSIAGGYTICTGGNLGTIGSTANASGGAYGYTYQWQISTTSSTSGFSNISGATGASYNPPAYTSDTWLRRRVIDGCGSTSYSNTIFIDVIPDPVVTMNTSNQTICVGGNRTLSASGSGGLGSESYQWQVSTDNSTWSNISGANSSTYNTGSLSATRYYRAQYIRSGNGCNNPYTSSVTVTVVPDPTVSVTGNGTVCVGGNRTLSASVSGGTGSASYQWQSSTNFVTWTSIGGATGSTYNTGALSSTTFFRVQYIRNGSGCDDPYSAPVAVSVVPDPSVSISGGTEICKNASTTLTSNVSNGTGSCSVTWQSSSNGTSGWANVGSGSSFNTGALSSSTYFRAVYSCNGSGCNTATSNVEQVVIDVTPPVASCKSISINLNASGTASITAAQIDNGSYDACSAVTLSASKTSFNCSNIGNNNVVLTVTDNNGNSSTCTATVVVNDVTPPVALCKDFSVELDSSGQASILASDINNGSYDACGIASVSVSPSTFNCGSTGFNTVTLTVTDNNGNSSTCTATVEVIDVLIPGVAPNVTCKKSIIAQLDANGSVVITPALLDNGSYDNCGLSLSVSPNTFDCSAAGSAVSVTLTGEDPAGNIATCASTVTIVDLLPPTMVCKNFTAQLDATGNVTISPSDVDGGSTDNCNIASLSLDIASFDCSDIGANTVTLTGVDDFGNSASCTATVFVEDNIAPNAICKAVTVQLDNNGQGSIVAADVNDGSNDACGVASLSLDKTDFDCSEVGTNTVTLTVTDNYNNSSTCTATVTVEDNVAPLITCPADIVVSTDAGVCEAYVNVPLPVTSDACGIASTVNDYNGLASASDTYPLGTTTVEYTTTDVNGNTATCSFTVTVEDNEAPLISCPFAPYGIFRSADLGQCYATISVPSPVTSDNCGVASVVNDFTGTSDASGQYPLGYTTVTWTVTDNSGNTNTCQDVIYVIDDELPVASCKNINAYVNSNGFVVINTSDVDNGSSDNCSVQVMTLSQNVFTCSELGANSVTLNVFDNSGNVNSCVSTVTVLDTIAPVASCKDFTVYLGANGLASVTPNDINNGSSDNCSVSVSLDKTQFDCSEVGANTVTLTATDGSGNTSTCTATVTVIDNSTPVASCKSIDLYLDASGLASIAPADVDDGSNDNCSFTLSLDKTDFNCSEVGANTVTLTVTDASGNSNTCTSVVNVIDTVPPVVACKNVTIYLDANGASSIQVSDLNDGASDACGIDSLFLGKSSFDCSNIGANTVKLSAVDVNGNLSSCDAIVTVLDTVSPVVACSNITVQLDVFGNASISPTDLSSNSDNCGIASEVLDVTTFDCSNVGANTVTLTVTDVNGNVSTCTSVVTVEDNENPEAVCDSITIYLDALGNASVTANDLDAGSNDACGIASLSLNKYNFDCSEVGSNLVLLTATDNNNNSSTCASIVSVLDTVAPVTICQNITVQLDASGNASIVPGDIDNGSSDACGIASTVLDVTSFDCSNVGANTVVLTVTDVNGNVSSCSATVTVEDNVAPIVSCSNITVQLDALGNASITPADLSSNSDNCGIASEVLDVTSFGCSNVGANTVTLTVTDVNGNVSTCTSIVTVEDNIDPVVVCQDVTIYLDASGNASVTANDIDNGTNDACGIASLTLDEYDFDCSEVGSNPVVLTAVDNNNNSASCNATVTVLDTVAPVALCQSITVQLDASGNASIVAGDIDNGSNDACGIASTVLDVTSFDCSNVGANTVVLTVTDVNGNVSTCSATVTVEDNVAPTITCIADIVVNNDLGVCGALVTYTSPVGTDACASSTAQVDASGLSSGDVFPVGTTVQTYEVTDASGNTATCSFSVTVIDNEAPAITCPSDISVVADSNDCDPVITWAPPVPTDNCAIASVTSNFNSGDEFYLGTHTVTYNVVDIHGNTNSCSFNITVTPKPQVLTLSSPTFACGYHVSCNGGNNGSISSYVAGGCLPYTYAWSNGETTADVSGLTAGTYTVTVTTSDGQTASESFTITEPDPVVVVGTPYVYPSGTNISCYGANDGSISLAVSGGCPPYTYTWFGIGGFSANTQDISNLSAGFYKGVVRDANNCTRVVNFVLTEPTPLVVDSVTSPTFAGGYNIDCNGSSSGNVDLTVSGANPPYTYSWSNGAVTEDLSNIPAGTYDVTITDLNGCTETSSITLTEPPVITFDACPDQEVVFGYYPENVAQISTFTGGGVPPYLYAWSTGETTSSITVSPSATTTYSVTVTDANGCEMVETHEVSVLDVRCGSKLDYVSMCDDKGNDKCVKQNDVYRRLNEGWSLGACNTSVNLDPGTCEEPTLYGCVCQDGIASIVVQYIGTSGVTVGAYEKKNQKYQISSYSNVQNGDLLSVDASGLSGGRFGNDVFMAVGGVDAQIETQCHTLEVGDTVGDFVVVEYTDVMSNTCNNAAVACECDDNISVLQIVFRGTSGSDINVWEDLSKTKLVDQFFNVQQGDTLIANGTLNQPTGKFNKETYFEIVGSSAPMIVINTDCKVTNVMNRVYGDYLVTGYIDKKDNACSMPTPCPCSQGIAHAGLVYSGPANATLYAFYDNGFSDTLGVFTNLQPGDTMILSAEAVNATKLNGVTYIQDAYSGVVTEVATDCKIYMENQVFGDVMIYGYVDATGIRCGMEDPSACDCEGGLTDLELEYDKYDNNSISNATIYAFSNSTRLDTIATWTGIDPGDVLQLSAASMPNGTFNNFTYLQIVGSAGPDIKIPTGCQYPIVGGFIREMYVLSYVDSMGNVCEDECAAGKTLMCHTTTSKGPHMHCIKNSDVDAKLQSGDWTIGTCPILKTSKPNTDEPLATLSDEFVLVAYPNPFSNVSNIKFTAGSDTRVVLNVYNTTGQLVRELFDSNVEKGKQYNVSFDAGSLTSGIYYYRLVTNEGESFDGKLIKLD